MGPLALANTTIADSRTFGAHMPYKLALPSKGIYLAIFFSIHAYLDKKLHILILPSFFNITDVFSLLSGIVVRGQLDTDIHDGVWTLEASASAVWHTNWRRNIASVKWGTGAWSRTGL